MTERSVTVRLIALTSQYDGQMRQAGRTTTDLGTRATVTSAQVEGLDRALSHAGNSAGAFGDRTRALVTAAVTFGPALVPIGAAAIGAASAFGLMGAAGIAAFKGIKTEIAQGTALGQVFAGALNELKGSLAELEHAAAAGMLGPFENAVSSIEGQMPFLNSVITEFSTALGKSGDNVLDGAIAGLHTMMPLLTDIAVDVERVTGEFKAWTENGGLNGFVSYARAALPQVEQVLTEVGQALAHLTASLTPVGGLALTEFGLLARAINAIPLPVLKFIAPALIEIYVAMKAYQGLSAAYTAISKFSKQLVATAQVRGLRAAAVTAAAESEAAAEEGATAREIAADTERRASAAATAAFVETAGDAEIAIAAETAEAAEIAAARYARAQAATVAAADAAAEAEAAAAEASGLAFGPLGIAVAAVGVGIGVLSGIFGHNADAANKDASAVSSLRDALIASGGAVTQDILANLEKQLQDDGLADKVAQMGISLRDLAEAIYGTDAQFAAMESKIDGPSAALQHQSTTLTKLRAVYVGATHDVKQYNDSRPSAAAQADTNRALATQSNQIYALGQQYGSTKKQIEAYAKTNNVSLDGTLSSTAAFEKLADATVAANAPLGQLRADVDKMNSSLSSATDQANAFTDALKVMSGLVGGDVVRSQDAAQESLNTLASTLVQGKGAFDGYSAAGLASRDALEQAVTAGEAYAQAVFSQTHSTDAATQAYQRWYTALVATAQAQGISKAALDAYLQSTGQLPSQVAQALSGMVAVGQDAGQNLAAGLASKTDEARRAGVIIGSAFADAFEQMIYQGNVPGSLLQRPTQTGIGAGIASVPVTALGFGAGSPLNAKGKLPGSGSGKTPAQTAHDKAVAADDLWAARAKAAIDPTNKLALAQEAVAEAQMRLNNEAKKGTTEYYQDLVKLHQAQADLTQVIKDQATARQNQLQALSDARMKLSQDTTSMRNTISGDQSAYQALLSQEGAATTKLYADLGKAASDYSAKVSDLISQRQADIEGFAAADQQVAQSWGSSVSFLTSNVADQADQIAKWASLLAQARARGVSEGTIQALGLDKGPQALGQLRQFSTATQAQIDQLNQAIAAKNQAAGVEANVEATNRYGQLGKDLLAAQQAYADQVTQLQQSFASQMADLAKQADAAMQKILDDTAKAKQALNADQQAVTKAQTGLPGQAAPGAPPLGTAGYVNVNGHQEHVNTAGIIDTPGADYGKYPMQVINQSASPNVQVFIGNQEITGFVTKTVTEQNAAKLRAIQVGGAR